jgi:hypothetical protein
VAIITKINLVRPRGLRIVRSYAVYLHNQPAYGDLSFVPPNAGPFHYPWTSHNHTNAIGARVPYTGNSANQTNLLLVLKTSGPKPTDKGINIWYHVGKERFHQHTYFGVGFTTRPGHC